MPVEKIDTLVIGAGQAGIAMSEHLSARNVPHLVVERSRIAEAWRTSRWDSLVANGPAWHDRFPNKTFPIAPDEFASAGQIVDYFEEYVAQIHAPVRCGVEVKSLVKKGDVFIAETTSGTIEASNVVTATGPFQKPVIPALVPQDSGITQLHSNTYRNPAQLPPGAVMVIGAGSSGVQIAAELRRAGRLVYLAVGPHDRPPRRYRGKDFCWWLGVLGLWDKKTPAPNTAHVTIAVSGADGGHTVDFRALAASGITLTGRAETVTNGVMHFAPDLAQNIAQGDANYLSMLDAADAYIAHENLDLPAEPQARILGPVPDCVTTPLRELNLKQAGIAAIIWATGYSLDFSWIQLDTFDATGNPLHQRGVSKIPGLYFLGLAWLSRRASPFIWGVWHDADYLAAQIAK
jgi:putative flavoprotein involved in K+ transport